MKLFTKTKKWLYVTALVLGLNAIGNAQDLLMTFDDLTFVAPLNGSTATTIGTYNDKEVSMPGYSLRLNEALVDDQASDHVIGTSKSVRFRSTNGGLLEMLNDFTNGADSIIFYVKPFGSDNLAGTTLNISYLTPGNSWVVLATLNNLDTYTLPTRIGYKVNISGNIRFKFEFSGGSGKRLNLDNLTIKPYVSVPCAPVTALDTINANYTSNTIQANFTSSATTEFEVVLVDVDNATSTRSIETASPVTLSGLVSGINYEIQVRAICGAGDTSTVETTGSFLFQAPAVPCAVVTGLDTTNADFAAGTIDVVFTSTATEFEVVLVNTTTSVADTAAAPATSPVTFTGLVDGETYAVQVRAICGAGDTSAVVSETFLFQTPPCAVVTGLDTVNADFAAGTIDVVFTSTATEFEVVLVNTTTSVADTAAAPATSPVTFTGLVDGETYAVQVRAICGAGDTSAVVSETFLFQAPVVPCAVVTGLDTVNADLAAGALDLVYTTTAPEVLVIVHDNTTNTTDSIFSATPPYIQGLVEGNNYTISIYAICGAGDTSATAATVTFDFGTAAVCAVVTGLDTVNADFAAGTIDVVFTSTATEFEVILVNTTTSVADTAAAPATSPVTFTGLVDGETYAVHVRAICGAGDTSVVVSETFLFEAPAPVTCDPVTNLVATNNTDGTITISWTAPSPAPADGYVYAVVPAGTTPVTADFATTNNTTVLNLDETTQATPVALANGASYDVYVKAVCSTTETSTEEKTTITVTNIGVSENAIALTVYPNPVAEYVYVNASNVDVTNATIAVLDITGKVVSMTNMVSEMTVVDMSNFASGVYFIKVQSGVNTKLVKVVKN